MANYIFYPPPYLDRQVRVPANPALLGILTVAPTVTTGAATAISFTSATGNGNVTDDGAGTISARGVCWGTSTNPDLTDSHAEALTNGEGAYTAAITGLTPGSSYYIRAYATNETGTSYGENAYLTTSVASSGGMGINIEIELGSRMTAGQSFLSYFGISSYFFPSGMSEDWFGG